MTTKKTQKNTASFTVNEIRDKIAKYCAYQDRCHWEVEQKLTEFQLIPEAYDSIFIYLIENKFLNEERFVNSFVSGKFKIKKWGKIKIQIELKKRKIPMNLIEKGLKTIDETEYQSTLEELHNKKKTSLKSERESWKKKMKIRNYLLQKGYEADLIYEMLNKA
ncbi:MAG: RecX family transcriptional regulator [Weeksellaceae bacterium]|nr:RecX family transcriptional regulator [Weeksellaceae bacterium]MDX9704355.1 RecX family transcriptional regulator [Weeksellaceae bacterium]